MARMMAAVFAEPGRIVLESRPVPDVGPSDALVRISTTTICGTDVHILRGEYPVRKGLIVGHELVGIIEKLGSQVKGYKERQRVIAGAITTSGHCYACLCGQHSQDGADTRHGFKPAGTVSIGFFSFAAFSFLARWVDSAYAALIFGGEHLVAALVLALIVELADRRPSAC